MTNTFEIRSGGNLRTNSTNILSGYAAVYNSLSQDLGGFVERILPGAFARTLAKPDHVRALYEHDQQRLLGRVGSDTLTLEETSTGLYFELTLPDTSYARDLGVLVERGDIQGCSFGFQVAEGGDAWEMRNGQLVRELIDVHLHEITITSTPAYLDTTVAVRSLEAWQRAAYLNAPSLWLQTV